MKFQLLLAALLFVSVALANPLLEEEGPEFPVDESEIECVKNALRDLEAGLDGAEDLGEDLVETLQKLKKKYDDCEEKNVENPSYLQERLYE